MSMQTIAVLNGAVQAVLVALALRLVGQRWRLWMHAAVLLVAAALYVVFAARAGSWGGIALELVGVALFGSVAFSGLRRRSTAVLALGWALHPVWDGALHTVGFAAAYTPGGYVAACFGFDLVLAALIASGWAGVATGLKPAVA